MALEEGGALTAGRTTLGVSADWPLCTGLRDGLATVVTIEDAVTALTTGVEDATQTVGIVGTDVTTVLL